jgi:hypothetical protein
MAIFRAKKLQFASMFNIESLIAVHYFSVGFQHWISQSYNIQNIDQISLGLSRGK